MLRRRRPLSEAECYVRLYGRKEDAVRIVEIGPERPGWAPRLPPVAARPPASDSRASRLSGEQMRVFFEERLDARDPELDEGESWAA